MADASTRKLAWFRRLLKVSPPPVAVLSTDPAGWDRERALDALGGIVASEAEIPEATRTRLYEPDGGDADTTIICWHGFTNAPSQFSQVAPLLVEAGYRVLVPRMPHHGQADLLTRDLGALTVAELTGQVNDLVDIASGLGRNVWVLGISAGGTLAAWAAVTRADVSRATLLAPLAAPVGFPMPLVRMLVKWPRLVPKLYWWWDPRVKADLVKQQGPYAYPGFPMRGLFPFLHLSEAILDAQVSANHELERVVVVTNPGDFAVRKDVAKQFALERVGATAQITGEALIDGSHSWMHDFIDPWAPSTADADQVLAILLASFGVGDPAAGGLLIPPLVASQPA